MAEKTDFEEPLRRAIEANLRYYEALGKVTQDYVRALAGVFGEFPLRINLPGLGTKSAPTTQPGPAPPTAPPSAATLVLEADAGAEAQGVFLVENRLNRTVSTAVMTSAFADPSGRAIAPALRVVPNVVTLEPGGRTFVQIIAQVSAELEPDVPYRGEVTVPGLSDHGIPVLLRRRPAQTTAPKAATAGSGGRTASAKPKAGPGSKAKTKSKRTAKKVAKKSGAAKSAASTPDTWTGTVARKRRKRTKRRSRQKRPASGAEALE